MTMRDLRDEVFYQIMPVAWRRGTPSSAEPAIAREYSFGNFRGMIDGIPYLRELGVTAVWINPIFPSIAYHGYQHAAPERVNSGFGTEEEFRTFVREAHGAGMRVFLDVVVYGVSDESGFYRASYANTDSGADVKFAYKDKSCTRPHGSTYTTWNGRPVGFVHWDLRDRATRSRVIDSTRAWLSPRHGDDAIDGFRLDHVWASYPHGPDGFGYNLDFWREWKDAMRRERSDVRTIAEQADWQSYGEDLLSAHDAVMSLPVMFAARRSLLASDATEFVSALEETLVRAGNPGRVLGVLGNHDVDRLATSIGADKPGQEGRLRAALAILLLSPLPPCVYYGDELGMTGSRLEIGGDLNDLPVRQPMRWRSKPSAESSRYHLANAVGAFESGRSSAPGISVEEQSGLPGSTLRLVRELVAARQRTKALRIGGYRTLRTGPSGVWAFLREEDEPVVGAVNLGPDRVRERIPVPGRDEFELDLPGFAWLVRPAPRRNHGTIERNPHAPRT